MLHNTTLNRVNIPAIWIHGAKLLLRHAGLRNITAEWIAEASRYHPENREIQSLSLELLRGSSLFPVEPEEASRRRMIGR